MPLPLTPGPAGTVSVPLATDSVTVRNAVYVRHRHPGDRQRSVFVDGLRPGHGVHCEDWTELTLMSSISTHSSLSTAFVVRMRDSEPAVGYSRRLVERQ